MKNHFNHAASGFDYKNTYRKKKAYCAWEYADQDHNWHNTNKWSSTTTTLHKGFGDVIYKTIVEKYDHDTPTAPVINPATARATEIVNTAFAEAIAESNTPARTTFFSRLLGRKP